MVWGGSFIQTTGDDRVTLWNEPISGLTQYVGDYHDSYKINEYTPAANNNRGTILKQDIDTAIAYTTGIFSLLPNEQKEISWQERLYTDGNDPVKIKSVTAKYVDIEGNTISDDVITSGNIGDDYTTEQKDIDGYTFNEVQGNPSGQFTEQPQTVTYIYTKNNVTPSPKPDEHSDIPESSKDNDNKNDSTSENKDTLPQTGDNEGLSIIGMVSGLLLMFGTSTFIIFKRKKQ